MGNLLNATLNAIMIGVTLVVIFTVVQTAWLAYDNSSRAATRRWRRINAARGQTCRCGKPGTVRHHIPTDWYIGDQAPAFWACAEHAHIPLAMPWRDGQPLIDQTREECCWRVSSDDSITDCGCGTHIGEHPKTPGHTAG